MKIAVGICTYKRNKTFKALLDQLDQHIKEENINNTKFDIVICDNSSNQAAKEVIKPTHIYLSNMEKGIANARNTILDYCVDSDYDYVLFLDDDEQIPPHFLEKYLHAIEQNPSADYIASYLKPIIDFDLSDCKWFQNTTFYRKPKIKVGPIKKYSFVATCNVLIKVETIRKYNLKFDSAFNVSGGSDILFFFQMQNLGTQGVWIDNPVSENIPLERQNYQYFKKRSLNTACAGIRAYRKAFGLPLTLLHWLPLTVAHFLLGSLQVFISLFKKDYYYKGMRHLYVSYGQTMGFFGVKKVHY